jgi:sortase family protein
VTKVETARQAGVRKQKMLIALACLVFIIAGTVLGYAPVATVVNNLRQHQQSQEYSQQIARRESTSEGKALNKAAIQKARNYNSSLNGIPILDPFLDEVENSSAKYQQYLGVLADSDVMSRIRVESAGIDLPVRHGTDDSSIATGAGHVYGTALPVGGDGNRSVLTAHTGMQSATLFDNLVKVRKGDLMVVETYGEKMTYKVTDIRTVLPSQSDALTAVPGKDLLTLMTCTPYGVNTHRLLVTGERVPNQPEKSSSSVVSSEVADLSLMMKAMAVVSVLLVAAGLMVPFAVRLGRSRNNSHDVSQSSDTTY